MKKEEKTKASKSIEKKGNTKKKNEVVNEKKTTKKENVFKVIARYFKGVVKEVKRIKWTSGKDLVKYSIAAVMFVIFFGLYFYGIEWITILVRSLAK